jgi:hypothetical protein
MSFGSENPELWTEICKRGIVNKLRSKLEANGFDDPDEPTLEAVIEVLYDVPKIESPLMDWAHEAVCASEADHWGGKIDEAVLRFESKKDY